MGVSTPPSSPDAKDICGRSSSLCGVPSCLWVILQDTGFCCNTFPTHSDITLLVLEISEGWSPILVPQHDQHGSVSLKYVHMDPGEIESIISRPLGYVLGQVKH